MDNSAVKRMSRTFVSWGLVFGGALVAQALDVEFDDVMFRLPEKGFGVSVVENGKPVRLLITNLGYADAAGRRPLAFDAARSNRIERLSALPGRTTYRVTYPVRGSEALSFSATYRFLEGVPGVTVTEEVLAVAPVRIHSWNIATGRNMDRARFFYDEAFRTKEGAIWYAAYPKRFAMTGLQLQPGESISFTRTAGRMRTADDERRLRTLHDRVICDGRKGPVLACRLGQPANGGSPDWSKVPVSAVRGETRDYRPIASNRWDGPKDLSFAFKAAYDDGFLYLRIDVDDDRAANPYAGKNIWLGDAVQFGIDPLMRKNGQDNINFIAAVAGSGPRLWGSDHPDAKYRRTDLSGVIRNASRLRPGGIVYELAIPWTYLAPFEPKNGSLGFSFAVIDQDGESNYETWMGLTDGVFGGRDSAKFAELALEGVADLSETAVRGAVRLAHTRDELLAQHARVAKLGEALKAKCAALAAAGKTDDYLKAVTAMTDYFLDFERDDLDAAKIWKNYREKDVPVTDGTRAFIYDRFFRNLDYLEGLLPKLVTRADETLAGRRSPERVVSYPAAERPQIADGGFRAGGRELFLYGPNTWLATASWTNDNDLVVMARTGFNFFNLFYAGGPRRDALMRLAERENLYCSWGSCTPESLTLDEKAWTAYWAEFDRPGSTRCHVRFSTTTPRMAFQIGLPEQFGKTAEKTAEWAAGFQRHLLAKFGSLEGLNAALGTSFADMKEIDFASALVHPALKYESMGYRLDLHLPNEARHLDFKRKRFDGLPMSGHYSTHYNICGLDPLVTLADFERIWPILDIVGFDGGTGLGANEFAIDFAMGCLDVDLARSFVPEKPIANNEDHIIPDGTYNRYTDEETYLSNILPFLLGQNAASVWVWSNRRHGEGEYAFTMANTYHASMRVAFDLRRAPEEIASFRRTDDPPFRILHSLPSLAERDPYVVSLYGLYAGCSFSGWPVRFLSERMVETNDFRRAKVIVVPDARCVSDRTFASLVRFAERGGRVVTFGAEALAKNEHGKSVPARTEALRRLFRRETAVSTREYQAVLEDELAKAGIRPPVRVIGADGKSPFGVLRRVGRTADGRKTLLVVNLNKKPVEVVVPGRWTDVLNGGASVSGSLTLATAEVRVLVR